MFVDAHLHLYDLAECYNFEETAVHTIVQSLRENLFCSNSLSLESFLYTEKLCQKNNLQATYSFGIHPQDPVSTELYTLEKLLQEKRIQIIGEMGFDLYDEKNRSTFKQQEKIWQVQLDLALQYNVPILLHLRKATQLVFKYAKVLKKIKAVLFHGWAGTTLEARSILNRRINAFFSIGKAILRGQKSVINMAKEFPLEYLVTESDAPYMQVKNEAFSKASDIKAVVNKIAKLRFEAEDDTKLREIQDKLKLQIKQNFVRVFTS